jgi:hypothetical protein
VTVPIIILEAATVSSVPVASAVVIFVIALFVLNPSDHLAWLAAFGFRFIQASAFITVQKRCRCKFLFCFCTTVATVPVAAAVIVFIVTSLVADETLGTAVTALWTSGLLLGWVQAFAL